MSHKAGGGTPDRPAVAVLTQPSFAALRHRGFRAYFATSALAMMADNVEHVISYWVMFEKFHSAALGGVAVLTHWLPFLFFSVYSGALADRFDSRRLIQISMLMFITVSLGWGLLFLADTIEVWHAVVLLSVHGLAGVLWGPASQLLIHDIVGREQLQSAVRLNATSRSLGILAAPAVGGALMQFVGGDAVFVFGIVLLLVWLAVASGMQPPAPVRTRLYHLPEMDDAAAVELRQRLAQLPGVREVMVVAAENMACLKVDRHGFDEAAVEQLIAKGA